MGLPPPLAQRLAERNVLVGAGAAAGVWELQPSRARARRAPPPGRALRPNHPICSPTLRPFMPPPQTARDLFQRTLVELVELLDLPYPPVKRILAEVAAKVVPPPRTVRACLDGPAALDSLDAGGLPLAW